MVLITGNEWGRHLRKKLILVLMVLAFCFVVLPTEAAEKNQTATNPKTNEAQAKKYPPYPDVWDWVAPDLERGNILSGNHALYMLSNGDVLYVYYESVPRKDREDQNKKVGDDDQKVWGFKLEKVPRNLQGETSLIEDVVSRQAIVFGGQTVVYTSSDIRILHGQEQAEIKLSDGAWVSRLRGGRYKSSNSTNHFELSLKNWLGKGFSIDCVWPVRNVFYLEDITRRGHGRYFVIYKLLDEP